MVLLWFSVNKLSLNASKTNYMVFGERKIYYDVDIKMNNNQITIEPKKNCLGIMIEMCSILYKVYYNMAVPTNVN